MDFAVLKTMTPGVAHFDVFATISSTQNNIAAYNFQVDTVKGKTTQNGPTQYVIPNAKNCATEVKATL